MRPKRITLTMAIADRNGICEAETMAAAGDMTIGGALASGGVATLDVPRHVSIYAANNESGVTFTVTGTDRTGASLTEDITGPNATTVKGVKNFATVTTVATDAATTGDVEVGSADELESQAIPIDFYANKISVSVERSSDANFTHNFKYTLDDLLGGTVDEHTATWTDNEGDKSENESFVSDGPVTGVRLKLTSYVAGSVDVNILTARGN